MICDRYDMQIADDLYVDVPCFYVFFIVLYGTRFYLQSVLFTYIQCRARRADCSSESKSRSAGVRAWRAPMERVAETAKLLCIPFFLKTSKDIFPYRSLA
jgi:hypothetical protein